MSYLPSAVVRFSVYPKDFWVFIIQNTLDLFAVIFAITRHPFLLADQCYYGFCQCKERCAVIKSVKVPFCKVILLLGIRTIALPTYLFPCIFNNRIKYLLCNQWQIICIEARYVLGSIFQGTQIIQILCI